MPLAAQINKFVFWGSKTASWAGRTGAEIAARPRFAMTAIGAVAGYLGSGGGLSGAAIGAGLGYLGGRKGWNTGMPGKTANRLGRWSARGASIRGLSKGEQDLIGDLINKGTEAKLPLRQIGRNVDRYLAASPSINYGAIRRSHSRAWSKGMQLGTLAATGFVAGAVTNVAMGMVGTGIQTANRLGSSFGGEVNSRYGATFSGMGNGIVGGY